MKRLRIAITKGRLLKDAIALFERAGLNCDALREDTRRLVLPLTDYPLILTDRRALGDRLQVLS